MRLQQIFSRGLGLGFGVWMAVSAGYASVGIASEYRFEVDPRVNQADLLQSRKVSVRTVRKGSALESDASAVVRVEMDRLVSVSIDYERYVAMGMPNTKTCHIVERSGGYPSVVWTEMSLNGVKNISYLAVEAREMPEVGEGAFGLRWSLVDRQPQWIYPSQPAFDSLDGSWYVERQRDGSVYVRYFLKGTLSIGLPGFLVDLIVKDQFESGIRRVVEILRDEAIR